MIAPLIPLFLAASFNIKKAGDWKYGPEILYNTRFVGTSPALDDSGRAVMFDSTVKLACRPKSGLSVICTFHKPTVVLSLWKSVDGGLENSEEYLVGFPNTTVFEVDYDTQNKRPLTVESSIDSERLDFVRALVDQLNFGTNFTNKTDENFEIVTNSIVGRCKTKYVRSINKVAKEDAKNNEDNERASMLILPDRKVLKGEIHRIHKTVDNDCIDRALGFTSLGVFRRLESTESYMIVSESNFTSCTDNVVSFHRCQATKDPCDDKGILFTGTERITVTLDEVVPAKGPLPTISDPMTFGFQATRVFHSDTTAIAYETKLYDEWLALINDKNNDLLKVAHKALDNFFS